MINISFQFNSPQDVQGFIDFMRSGPMNVVEGLVMNARIQLQQQTQPPAETPVDTPDDAPVDPNA